MNKMNSKIKIKILINSSLSTINKIFFYQNNFILLNFYAIAKVLILSIAFKPCN